MRLIAWVVRFSLLFSSGLSGASVYHRYQNSSAESGARLVLDFNWRREFRNVYMTGSPLHS